MNDVTLATPPSVTEAAARCLLDELPVHAGLAGRLWEPFSSRWWSSTIRIYGEYADSLLVIQHADDPALIGLASEARLMSAIAHSDLVFLLDHMGIEVSDEEDLMDCLRCAVRKLQRQVTWGSREDASRMVDSIESSPPETVLVESDSKLLRQIGVELRRRQEIDMDLESLDTITTYTVGDLEGMDDYLRGVRAFLGGPAS